MTYYSLNGKAKQVNFETAVRKGEAVGARLAQKLAFRHWSPFIQQQAAGENHIGANPGFRQS